jgi:uncharacterized protein YjaG (DUF416 family)
MVFDLMVQVAALVPNNGTNAESPRVTSNGNKRARATEIQQCSEEEYTALVKAGAKEILSAAAAADEEEEEEENEFKIQFNVVRELPEAVMDQIQGVLPCRSEFIFCC